MPYKFLNKYPKKFRGTGIIVPVAMAVKRIIKSTIHRPVTIMYPYEKECFTRTKKNDSTE